MDPVTASFVTTCLGAVLPKQIEHLTVIIDIFKKTTINTERLQEFENLLLIVEKVLADAEEKQIKNHSVRRWVDNVRDVFYDAEDLLDGLETERSRPSQHLNNKQTRDFNNSLEEVYKKLNSIKEQIGALGLKEGHAWRSFPRLPTTSLLDKSSKICLRKIEKDKIIDFLTKAEKKKEVAVVSIVGSSGIGKTTLAQFVYNDEKVRKHFHFRVWAHVSEIFDVFKVTKTIYESTALGRSSFRSDSRDSAVQSDTLRYSGIEDLELLQATLESELTGKKILLVLDNVWNVSSRQWDLLRKPLQSDQFCGSRIILTTCSRNVSSTVRSKLVHDLKLLSTDDSQFLFEEKAFGDEVRDPILKEIGNGIVKKCGGLPLALETLGGLLHSKAEAEEWENILNSKIWDLPDDRSDILPALRSSYDYLPSQLKRCFAYCSIFPKGHEFEKLDLVRMWIAEGLVQQPNSGRSTQEVGLQYFDELISRSIFQQSGDDQSRFIMHDLVNDLAQHIAGEFVFRFEHDSPLPNPARVRHLSCKLNPSDKPDKYSAFYGKNKLRTFLSFRSPSDGTTPFDPNVFENLFPNPSRLRVLSLSSYSSINEFPHPVRRNLKHLRYLDLSGTDIPSLPDEIGLFYNLETLKLSDCHRLTHLPEKLSNLTKLEHLDIKGTKIQQMPPKFGDLKRIQQLTDFVVGSGSPISELKDLCLLRTLSILQLQNVAPLEDAEKANLKQKIYLRELILDWSHWTVPNQNIARAKRPGLLNKLQPGQKLEKLEIKNFCEKNFPTWLGNASLSRMKFLSLKNCHYCTSLPTLGQLPSLKALTIEDFPKVKTVGSEFYGTGNLVINSLETLKFKKMHNWKKWLPLSDGQTGFASLRKLDLIECKKLPRNYRKQLVFLRSTMLKVHRIRTENLQSPNQNEKTKKRKRSDGGDRILRRKAGRGENIFPIMRTF